MSENDDKISHAPLIIVHVFISSPVHGTSAWLAQGQQTSWSHRGRTDDHLALVMIIMSIMFVLIQMIIIIEMTIMIMNGRPPDTHHSSSRSSIT